VSDRSLYSMRSFILSQCRDLRMGVIWEDLGALTTVRARQFAYLEDASILLSSDNSDGGTNGSMTDRSR